MSFTRKRRRQLQQASDSIWSKHERQQRALLEGFWINQATAGVLSQVLQEHGIAIPASSLASRYAQDLAPATQYPLASDRTKILHIAASVLLGRAVPSYNAQ